MKNNKLSVLALATIALIGCATPYQQIGTNVAGGFYSERISDNRFVVSFRGNGFTNPKKARDFALLRAADVTLEYNYKYFTIDGQSDLSHMSMIDMGSTSTTYGNISPGGNYSGTTTTTSSEIPVFKPGSRLTITCFDELPNDKHAGKVFDAAQLDSTLRAEYKLK